MKAIILKSHCKGRDTIVYKNHVANANFFYSLNDEKLKLGSRQRRLLEEAIKSGKGNADTSEDLVTFAFNYCREVEIDPEMRQIVLDSGDDYLMLLWCIHIGIDPDMRQIVLNANIDDWAYKYCCYVEIDPEMRQVILNEKSSNFAYKWCLGIGHDDDMRQVIIDSKNAKWAYEYCFSISNDDDMRQAILDSKDDYWIEQYNEKLLKMSLNS